MSDHYCCKACGLRYDDCSCPDTPPKKVKNIAFAQGRGRGYDWQRVGGFVTIKCRINKKTAIPATMRKVIDKLAKGEL
jgi:hypothetical protein